MNVAAPGHERGERRLMLAIAVAIVPLALLVFRAGVNLRTGLRAIGFPFGLDYGEGIVWQQALLIPGPRMYGDITRYPFIVFHYPPVYHLAVRLIAASGLPMLEAGRLVSFLACLGIAAATASIVHAMTTGLAVERRIAGLACALLVLASGIAASWAFVMRVDMLAIFLNVTAVALAVRSMRRPWLLWPAIVLFTAAVFTKQTAIWAPLATMTVFLVAMPRRALASIGLGLALSIALLLWLQFLTDGGFLRHVVLYNVNRLSVAAFLKSAGILPAQSGYITLAVTGFILAWAGMRGDALSWRVLVRRLREEPALLALSVVTMYWLATAASLLMMAKSGSSTNYAAEFICVSSIPAGRAAAAAITCVRHGRERAGVGAIGALLILLIICAQARTVVYDFNGFMLDQAALRDMAAVEARMRGASKPIVSDDMVLLLQAGKTVPWEPSIVTELAAVGRWDERPIVERIEAGDLAFFYTFGLRGDPTFDSRYSPAVSAAIDRRYPIIERHGDYFLHLPAGA